MSSTEFTYWLAYFQLEPFGPGTELLAPQSTAAPVREEPEQMYAKLLAVTRAMGGAVNG